MTSRDNQFGTATRGPQRVTGRPGWDQHPGVRTGRRLRLGEHSADVVSRAAGSWIYLIVITTAVVATLVVLLPDDREAGALALLAIGFSALTLVEVTVLLLAARRAERIATELALYHLDQARRATAIAEDLREEMGRLHADLARITAHTDIAGHPVRHA